MRPIHWKILLRGALLVAIVASTALFVDYSSAVGPSFCGVGSGCAQVRASAFAHPFGIPMPVFGLLGFSTLYLLATWARTKRHLQLLALGSLLGALGALGLIVLMVFVIKAVCPWCMGVDVGALVAAVAAVLLLRAEPVDEAVAQRGLWTATAVGAVLITLLWGRDPEYRPPPDDVAKLQVPGKVTMVVFTDFQCPFCQLLHPVIDDLAQRQPDKVASKLVMVPLPIHPGADIAARTYLCADEPRQAKLSHALYTLPWDEMIAKAAGDAAAAVGMGLEDYVQKVNGGDQAAGLEFKRRLDGAVTEKSLDAAVSQGLDRAKTAECMGSESTKAELLRQSEMFDRTKLEGLPSTYVANYLVQGADETMLRSALDAALAGGVRSVRWMFVLVGGLFLVMVVLTLRGGGAAGAGAAPTVSAPGEPTPAPKRPSKRPPAGDSPVKRSSKPPPPLEA